MTNKQESKNNKISVFINKHSEVFGILLMILIIFSFAPIVYFLVSTPSCIGFINLEEQSTWIAFYGSLLTSFFTLLGVKATINYTEKSRLKDIEQRDFELTQSISAQYKPILSITFDSNFNNIDDLLYGIPKYNRNDIENYIGLHRSDCPRFCLCFELRNVGRGEAENIELTVNFEEESNCIKLEEQYQYSEIIVGKGISISFYLQPSDIELESLLEIQKSKLFINVKYQDFIGNKYLLKGIIKIKGFAQQKNEKEYIISDVWHINPMDCTIEETRIKLMSKDS